METAAHYATSSQPSAAGRTPIVCCCCHLPVAHKVMSPVTGEPALELAEGVVITKLGSHAIQVFHTACGGTRWISI